MRFILDQLEEEVKGLGRPEWRPLLDYVAALHGRSINMPRFPLKYPWEEIGPGYINSPAFGHWDIIHSVLDSLPVEPLHCRWQLLNNLSMQQPNGLIPGSLWMKNSPPEWNLKGHPPIWVYAIDEYCRLNNDYSLAAECLESLERNIKWYEKNRQSDDGGFFYTFDGAWESGIDEGIRFDSELPGRRTAVDATSHVYWLYDHAARWAAMICPAAADKYRKKTDELKDLISNQLFDPETGFFHDIWSANKPELRILSFEGIWPVVTGAASHEQAQQVIDRNLLDPERFFTPHPIATVAVNDPRFEPRMWRGPAWNSMTYWAAVACMRYERYDAAAKLLERALDASSKQFLRTGTIWEFYDAMGNEPEKLHRKPAYDQPCKDYLGHNPLIAMARLWEECTTKL